MSVRRAISSTLVLLLIYSWSVAAQRGAERQCKITTPLKAIPGLPEASGVAVSRSTPRRLFTMNDSFMPEVTILGLDGSPQGKVTVKGAEVTDWEDVTTATCPDGPCLYVSDVGDNNAVRRTISIYRMPEPKPGDREVTATRFDAVFPDGPKDAEAVFAGPDGRLYLLTKEPRGAALYGFPAQLTPGRPNRLEPIAMLTHGAGRDAFARITDAESSEDGRTVAVRSNDTLFIVPATSLLAGRLADAAVFSLRHLGEPQGEGVALGPDGEVFVTGEGGPKRGVGGFARLSCVASR
jgi:hypothetical protein